MYELAEAVAWEASQRMGVAREAIQSDWIRTGAIDTNGQSRAEVLMVAARRETLDMKLKALVDSRSSSRLPLILDFQPLLAC